MGGSDFCFFHDSRPETVKKRIEAAQRGGQANKVAEPNETKDLVAQAILLDLQYQQLRDNRNVAAIFHSMQKLIDKGIPKERAIRLVSLALSQRAVEEALFQVGV